MYRTTAQSRVLEEAFRTSEFRYRIVGGVRFYERKEVRDILAVLRLLHNPADAISLGRVIENLPIGRGFGPRAMELASEWSASNGRPLLEAFTVLAPRQAGGDGAEASPPAFAGAGRAAAQRIGTVFATLQERARTQSLSELFDSVVELTEFRRVSDESTEEELQRWANVLELRTDLERYDHLDPEAALTAYLEQVALISDADTMDEDAGGLVTLITLHSAKGLEFPVVFIAGAEEGLLPISRAVEAEPYDTMPMEEERRLFYVGITRAQRLLYITFAGSRVSYGQFREGVASRFVDSLPAEVVRSVTREVGLRAGSGRPYGRRQAGSLSARAAASWSTPMPTPAPAREPLSLPDYTSGTIVFHPKFGEGEVVEVSPRKDGDLEVAVEFRRHGRKRLMASLANMEIVR